MYSHPTPPEVRLSVKRPASLQMHTRYLVTQGAFSGRQANRCSTGNIGKPETLFPLYRLYNIPPKGPNHFCLVSGEDRVWRAPCPNLGLSRVSRVAHLPTQREQKKQKPRLPQPKRTRRSFRMFRSHSQSTLEHLNICAAGATDEMRFSAASGSDLDIFRLCG